MIADEQCVTVTVALLKAKMSSCSKDAEAIEMDSVVLNNTTAFALESGTNGQVLEQKAGDQRSGRISPRWNGTDVRGKIRASLRRVPVKKWQKFELGVLVVLIVVVWGLAILPVIFYYHPESEVRICRS